MPGALSIASAALSFIALVLVAIAMATNYWVKFDLPRPAASSTLNPPVENTQFAGLPLSYDLDYFGLWVGCHRETSFNKTSCGYIGASCYSTICWIRNNVDEACRDARVAAIDNCSAYQATRAMAIIGTIFLIVGASVLLVSVCVTSTRLAQYGALSTLAAALFLMIAFAVFQGAIFAPDLDDVASTKWSFALFTAAWPIALVAGAIAIAAKPSKQHVVVDDDDISE